MSMKMANAEFYTKTHIFKNTVHLSQGQLFIKICINIQRSQQVLHICQQILNLMNIELYRVLPFSLL